MRAGCILSRRGSRRQNLAPVYGAQSLMHGAFPLIRRMNPHRVAAA